MYVTNLIRSVITDQDSIMSYTDLGCKTNFYFLANSIKKIHSEPILSKNKKYTDKTVAKRRDPPAEPNDAPL